MNIRRFNEDTRVKIPATIQFLKIGYDYQSLKDDTVNIDFQTKIFINRFKPSIEKLNNTTYTLDEISEIISDINKTIRNNDLGKAFYNWLINPNDKIKLIDFDDFSNNDFAVVDELPYSIQEGTEEGSFRPDINILINGIPLGFLEVKQPNNDGGIQEEFNRMINRRLKNAEYKRFFNMLQLVSFSNNMEYEDYDDSDDVKAGSFYTTPNGQNTSFSFFREDGELYHQNYNYTDISIDRIKEITKDLGYSPKEVDSPEFQTNLSNTSPCNSFITSVFDKERLLYMIQYGMMFIKGKVPEKHIMRYPQFFATRKIIERFENGGKNGIIWHTQGSGKTALSAYCSRILNDYFAKKDITARFFFIVDRLDLLQQASIEFSNRGIKVTECDGKDAFKKELSKPIPKNRGQKSIGEICVTNIQKLDSGFEDASNTYNVKLQRIFFIDEAHRSYNVHGEYFARLMTCDTDGIFIALTGTPLLTKKERSNLKFGEYIHKYFYDKSIADRYTLKIKKEEITTVEKAEIKQNLEIEDADLNKKDVYESLDYVKGVSSFIERDFKNFRFVNGDKSLGAMIVCRSNPQAKLIHDWFEKNSSFKTGLVISEPSNPQQTIANKNNQMDFHDTLVPDILVVNFMLTTGYDVKRLKKMYLLRGPHAHSLLQTISRVNRPYKSPTGRTYKYGYITDFIDIETEYNNTLANYIKELEEDMNDNGEDEGSLTNLVVDKETINEKYKKLESELSSYPINRDNLEIFSQNLSFFNKDALLKIRKVLKGMVECYNEFRLSNAKEYLEAINNDATKKMLSLVQKRIDFMNLKSTPIDTLSIMNNDEVIEVVYEFIKTGVSILDLSKFTIDNPEFERFARVVTEIKETIQKNKNLNDIRIENLDTMLQEIFDKLSISNIEEMTEELQQALNEATNINYENERLASQYDGHFAFVKTYQDYTKDNEYDSKVIEKFLKIVYEDRKNTLKNESLNIQGRKNFVDTVKSSITTLLLKEKLYKAIKPVYDQILSDLYTNLKLY